MGKETSIYDDLPDIPEGGIFGVVGRLRKKKGNNSGNVLSNVSSGLRKARENQRTKSIAKRKKQKYMFKARLNQRAEE